MSRQWIVWYAIVLHVVWGVMLLLFPAVGQTTPLHAVVSLVGSPFIAGIAMIVAGLLALSAIVRMEPSVQRLFVLFPQQFLMMVSAFGAINLMLEGHYADGIVRPHVFIFVDQLPAVLAAFLHTASLVEHHWGVRWDGSE